MSIVLITLQTNVFHIIKSECAGDMLENRPSSRAMLGLAMLQEIPKESLNDCETEMN